MTKDELDAAFLGLVESGEFDRILRNLRNAWDRVPRETVLDVVQEAATEVVRRHQDGQIFTNLAGLITTIARRNLIKVWEVIQEAEDVQSALKLRAKYPDAWRHDEERAERIERAAGFVRTLLPGLDNENYRLTLSAILDAAQQGKQLMPKDLAEQLDCSPNTASKWMERAPQRLLPVLTEAGFDTLDGLLNTLPLQDDHDNATNEEQEEMHNG